MKATSRTRPGVVACTLLTICLVLPVRPASGQLQPDPVGFAPMNSLALDLTPVAASVAYARSLESGAWIGAGLGAGAQVGFMIFDDEFSRGGYGVDRFFVELLHGDVLFRTRADRRLQVETGVRAAWLYHPPTEYETRFFGVQAAALVRVGRVRLGPRIVIGHMTEEAGRGATNVGLVPLIARIEWTW